MSNEAWSLPPQEPPPDATLAWLERTIGGTVRSVEVLQGGLSSAVHRVDLDGSPHDTVVVRRMTQTSWLEREPEVPHREASILRALGDVDIGVATPTLVAADPGADETDVPTVVMTYVPGRPEIDPDDPVDWAERLAACLARLHNTPEPAGLTDFRRWDDPNRPPPEWVADTDAWDEARARVDGPLPEHPWQFVHRDFHPNNIHWERGEIVGVVDWLEAVRGPRAVDVTHCRWNLAILHSDEIADLFLDHYRQLTGYCENVVAYDLATVLSVGPGPIPTFAWNVLGRSDLTPDVVAARCENWLAHLLASG